MMFKILGLILIVALLVPIGFFAWRTSQPMSMPEYGGRTYYELLAERRQAYADLAHSYQASHPKTDVKNGICFRAEVVISLTYSLPWAGLCAASEFIPILKIYGPKSKSMGCGQVSGRWMNFPDVWWRTYERLLYTDIFSTRPQSPVPYFRMSAP